MSFDPSNFDPNKHKSEGGELCKPGTYICIAMKAERKNDRGKPQIDFIIQPVINAETGEIQREGTSGIFETATLTEKAVWRFANMCEAIDTGPFNANSNKEIQEKVLGRPFKAVVVKDSYNGLEKRKITGYKKLNSADEKRFAQWQEDASLETSMGSGDSGGSKSSGSDDDDIPF